MVWYWYCNNFFSVCFCSLMGGVMFEDSNQLETDGCCGVLERISYSVFLRAFCAREILAPLFFKELKPGPITKHSDQKRKKPQKQ
jgi:hypothetical protein